MTHNSLEANQRPHISLIDRRHFDHAALPIGLYVKRKCCKSKAGAVVRLLTALSHINVRLQARAARGASLCKPLLGGTLSNRPHTRCGLVRFVRDGPRTKSTLHSGIVDVL